MPRKTVTESHYSQMDQTIQEYNEVYFKPAKAKLDELYERGFWIRLASLTSALRWSITNSGIMRAGGREWGLP